MTAKPAKRNFEAEHVETRRSRIKCNTNFTLLTEMCDNLALYNQAYASGFVSQTCLTSPAAVC